MVLPSGDKDASDTPNRPGNLAENRPGNLAENRPENRTENRPEDRAKNRGSALRNAGLLFGSGTQLAISVAVMFFLGRWADEKLHTAPWLLIGGVLVGVGAGLASFIRTAMSLDDREKKEDRPAQ